jgi:hypothetical protein
MEGFRTLPHHQEEYLLAVASAPLYLVMVLLEVDLPYFNHDSIIHCWMWRRH